jgi:hypothetical protein
VGTGRIAISPRPWVGDLQPRPGGLIVFQRTQPLHSGLLAADNGEVLLAPVQSHVLSVVPVLTVDYSLKMTRVATH